MPNNKYQIGIIGKGSVGVVALLNLIYSLKSRDLLHSTSISLIYTASIPITGVGEASTWMLLKLLDMVLGEKRAHEVWEECNATPRHGASFEWEGASPRDFTIKYPSEGIHFDGSAFGDSVVRKVLQVYPGLLNLVEEKVYNISNLTVNDTYTFNLIFNCAGSPTPKEMKYSKDYIMPAFKSVNSALLYQKPLQTPNAPYSHTLFHKNGWMFRIPLEHREGLGYLFNSSLTTKELAIEDFRAKVPGIPADAISHITWEYYYRTNIVEDGIVYLGNKLYFFEPTQAIPIHFYIFMLNEMEEYYIDGILLGNTDKSNAECSMNKIYQSNIHQALSLICFSYTGDMEIDSIFWKRVSKDAKDHLAQSGYYKKQLETYMRDSEEAPSFWTHSPQLMKQYIDGFHIPLPEKIKDE